MICRRHVVKAIFKRNLLSFFNSPAAYVFITIFIVACALFQFTWDQSFYLNNMAELSVLNKYFPYLLLFFIPVITMNVWSEEKKLGTDEYLLTLPASDFEVVLSKYLSILCTYCISLLFSMGLVVFLNSLADLDWGLIVANYVSYLLLGAAMLSVGMVASILTKNNTIAFILSLLFNAVLMFSTFLAVIYDFLPISDKQVGFFKSLGFNDKGGMLNHFQDLASGILTFSGVVYFLSIVAIMLYLNMIILGKRHWERSGRNLTTQSHYLVRVASLLLTLVALNVILTRLAWRSDLTSEKLFTFNETSKELLASIDRPVYIEAYISPEVPASLIETRQSLLYTLREIEAAGRGKVQIQLHEAKPKSKKARLARERYRIYPQQSTELEKGHATTKQYLMSVAMSSGSRQEVVRHFHKGESVEYSLIRSIRIVNAVERRRIGILRTPAHVKGGFDFKTQKKRRSWKILGELAKQYELIDVDPKKDYPEHMDALIAVQPVGMSHQAMIRLREYIYKGGKTLLAVDPLPAFDISQSPSLQVKASIANNADLPGSLDVILPQMGIDFDPNRIAFNGYNPHPGLNQVPLEFNFLTREKKTMNLDKEMTKHLEEVVAIFPGFLSRSKDHWATFTPLLHTSGEQGYSFWEGNAYEPGPQSPARIKPFSLQRQRLPSAKPLVIAAQVQGETDKEYKGKDGKMFTTKEKLDLIVLADVDLLSDQFFKMRRQGRASLDFDNVNFILNAVDSLVGDESFITLRSLRKKHRPLKTFDEIREVLNHERSNIIDLAEQAAVDALALAEKDFKEKVDVIAKRDDLKLADKRQLFQTVHRHHSRLLETKKKEIQTQKEQAIQDAEESFTERLNEYKQRLTLMSLLVPPILPLLIGFILFFRRRRREMTVLNQKRIQE